MPTLYTDIEINASKHQVWQILINKQRWHEWNSYLFDADPTLPFQAGQQVFLSVRRVQGEQETTFDPVVTSLLPEVCLQWFTQIPGYRNEHIFELQEIGIHRTQYIHRQYFSGILTRVFLPFIRSDEKKGMERMARELKRYVERFSVSI
jgi:hypothetical protein